MVDPERAPAPEPTSAPRPQPGTDGLGVFDGPGHDEAEPQPRSRRLGVVTFVLALVLAALDGLALALLAADVVGPAAVIALVTLLASIVVGVVALIAVAMRRGRAWGVAAVLLSVASNPFVLVWLIGRFVSTV